MYKLILFIFITSLYACKEPSFRAEDISHSADSIKALIKAHDQYSDSLQQSYNDILNLPDIRHADHEAYLFWWDRPFGQSYVYFIDNYNNKITLRSRCVKSVQQGDTLQFPYRKKMIEIYRLTVLDSSEQVLSTGDWDAFKTLIKGSYVWLFNSPNPDDGFTDGEMWLLKGKTKICCPDSLIYHSVSIHIPHEGSFKSACKFLIDHSVLTKDNAVDRMY